MLSGASIRLPEGFDKWRTKRWYGECPKDNPPKTNLASGGMWSGAKGEPTSLRLDTDGVVLSNSDM